MYAFLSEVKENSFSSVVHYDSWFISHIWFPQIGADGMNSAVRKAGKFHVFQQDYKQQAVVATLEVSGVSRLSNNFLTSLRFKFCLHKKKILEVFGNLVLVKISCCEPVS